MAELRKVRVQLLNESTGAVEEEVNVLTSAECVTFADAGKLRGPQGLKGEQGIQGPKGDTGATGLQGPKGDTGLQGPKGATGAKGDKGDKGDPGDTVKVGTSIDNATQKKLFFKIMP